MDAVLKDVVLTKLKMSNILYKSPAHSTERDYLYLSAGKKVSTLSSNEFTI